MCTYIILSDSFLRNNTKSTQTCASVAKVDDGGLFVHTETCSVRLLLLKQLLALLHTGRYAVVHLYQKFSIAPPGRTWHNDEFQNAIFRKFSKHIFAFFATPCSNVGYSVRCPAFVAMHLVSSCFYSCIRRSTHCIGIDMCKIVRSFSRDTRLNDMLVHAYVVNE